MKSSNYLLGLTLVVGIISSPLCYADFAKENRDIYLNADGSEDYFTEREIYVKDRKDVKDLGEFTLNYNADTMTVKVIEAYTIKPDGSRIKLAEKDIHDQAQAAIADAPVFTSLRAKTLVFPALEPGSRIYMKTHFHYMPLFAGEVQGTISYSPRESYDEARSRITAPASLPLRVKGEKISLKAGKNAAGDKVWEWNFSAPADTNFVPEETVSEEDFSKQVHYSTLKDWSAYAEEYRRRTEDKATITPAIAQLATEITKPAKNRRDEARLLYQWVSQNIRYVQVYLNDGHYIPHAADEVLKNRYGDCKDKAVLLKALLKSRGIDSSLVLLSASTRYTLPELPTMDAFNHVIVYLPEWHLYADPTQEFLPFGVLATTETDKPALHIDDGKGIQHIPQLLAEEDGIRSKTYIKVGEDGRMSGSTELEFLGASSVLGRQISQNVGDDSLRQVGHLRDFLGQAGYSGKGEWLSDVETDLSMTSLTHYFKYELDQKLERNSLWSLPRMGYGERLFQRLATVINLPEQTPRRLCFNQMVDESMEVQFPKEWKAENLPKPVSLQTGGASYQANYVFDESSRTFKANWLGKFSHEGNTCDGSELRTAMPFVKPLTRKDVLLVK
ncbi:DUF3857 and transglutaminase domain-containing protein [Pseudogulbenkiania sp. MAI-1]|uniref:DUF3857 domain-containing transglutaminase family protein n=1 Tax=Pseudogulbenkiania sp. MAI-1 TaxID=990370 RepID=UPI00045E7AAB|nr:DUF3857 and transglutaminase domain-containing protein [Pseudogulbenkiania sp. MAI-1]